MPDATPQAQREMLSLLTARVRDTAVAAPLVVDGASDVLSVCRQMAACGRTGVLVHDATRAKDAQTGIFTTTDLRDALLLGRALETLPVREAARFELVEVAPEANLFEALRLMVRHRVHRLLVRDGAQAHGVLSQTELVRFVAQHSHVVALQIEAAGSQAELADAAQRVDALLALLHDGGLRIERVARLIGDLNRRVYTRLWTLVAPPEIVAGSCLLVMGSEGRGEQIQKTDQDNALLLRDGFEHPQLQAATQAFSRGLIALGWPPCPGNIMLTNPRWCASVATFKDTVREWIYGHDAEAPMHLAIFFDAAAVAGDATLLAEVQSHLDGLVAASDAFVARFGAAADQFQAPTNWWAQLTGSADERPLDLKKLGTFPIVHGVRALCLKHGVRETGTSARIERLRELGVLDANDAVDLAEALHFLMGLKLRHQLRQRSAGEAASNLVRPSALSTMERAQFKNALAIIRGFRGLLRQRLRLDSV
jgi:CBS domain-containing protein